MAESERKSFVDFLESTVWPVLTNRTAYARYKFQVLTSWTLIAVATLSVIIGWRLFGPLKPEASRNRREAAKVCAAAIRADLRENRGDARTMTCVPFVGDSTDEIFTTTMEILSTSGTFDVRGLSPINRVRRFLGLSFPASDDAKVAARKARRGKADVALCGAVHRYEQTESGVDLVVEYRIIDAKTGLETFNGTYDSKLAWSSPEGEVLSNSVSASASMGEGARSTSRFTLSEATRSLVIVGALWLLAALAIPIVSFRFLECAAAKRSNAANFFALLVCFVADALCALLLVAPTFQNWRSWFGVVVMTAFALWYDLQVLHLAHRRTELVSYAGV